MSTAAAGPTAKADLGRRTDNPVRSAVPGSSGAFSPGGQQTQGAVRRCACGGVVGAGGECAACRQKRQANLRMVRSGFAARSSIAGPSVHSVLSTAGRPLEANARRAAERAFGLDLGSTRIHSGPDAAASAASVGAAGYAIGRHVVFGSGRYEPDTTRGQALLMHELAHVAQQRGAEVPSTIEIGGPSDREEYEARAAARGTVLSDAPARLATSAPRLRRQLVTDTPPAGFCQPEVEEGIRRSHIELKDGTVICRAISQTPCAQKSKTISHFRAPTMDDPSLEYQVCRGNNVINVNGRVAPSGDTISGGGSLDFTHVLGRDSAVRGSITPGTTIGMGGLTGTINTGVIVWKGGVAFEIGGENVTSSERRGTAKASLAFGDTGWGVTPYASVGDVGGRTDFQVGLNLGKVDIPKTPTPCFQCLCPPAEYIYTCRRPKVAPPPPAPVTKSFRYYFAWDTAKSESEDLALRRQTDKNLDDAVKLYESSGEWHVVSITGFASPEGREAHNQPLSKARAEKLSKLLRDKLKTAILPPPVGAGELLGRRPGSGAVAPEAKCDAEALTRTLQPALHNCRPGDKARLDLCDSELRARFKDLLGGPYRACAIQLLGGPDVSSDVDVAVGEFIKRFQSGELGQGVTPARPWDEIFRPLRFAEVVISGTPTAPPAPTGMTSLPGSECDQLAAANAKEFGPTIQLPPLKGCDPNAAPGG
jgi:hypothetical protein